MRKIKDTYTESGFRSGCYDTWETLTLTYKEHIRGSGRHRKPTGTHHVSMDIQVRPDQKQMFLDYMEELGVKNGDKCGK